MSSPRQLSGESLLDITFPPEPQEMKMTDEEYKQRQTDFVEEQAKMARQKQIAPATIELDEEEVGTELQTATQSSADFALANQLLGRIQFGQGIAKLVTVTTLLDLQKIKESKLYKHLPHLTADEKVVTVTSWSEFCKLLGRSVEQVDEDLRNLDAFGSEALESMQQMGLGYRDLRKLRKMPDDDRNLVIEQVTVDMGDKEAVKESILEILETQTRKNDHKLKEVEAEKAKLQAKLDDSLRTLEAKNQIIAKKATEIQNRDKAIAELEAEKTAALEVDSEINDTQLANNLSELINNILGVDLMRLRKQIVEIQTANAPEYIHLQCGQVVVQLIAELQAIQVEYQLDIPQVENTSWVNNVNTALEQD